MAPYIGSIQKLCAPALVFFILSMIGFFWLFVQNLANLGVYKFGEYSIFVPSLALVYIFKLIYIFFWTYVLNLICKDGYPLLSWALIFLPWIILFFMVSLVMFNTYNM